MVTLQHSEARLCECGIINRVIVFPGIFARMVSDMGALLAGIGTDSAQAPESLQDDFRLSEDRNRVGLETCARSETGFKLAAEDYSREREFDGSGGKRGAKEDFGRPAAGDGHEPHAQGNEALGSQELFGRRDEFFGVQGNQIGLIFMDLGLVSGVNGPSFLRGERQVAEALAGAVFAGRRAGCSGSIARRALR